MISYGGAPLDKTRLRYKKLIN